MTYVCNVTVYLIYVCMYVYLQLHIFFKYVWGGAEFLWLRMYIYIYIDFMTQKMISGLQLSRENFHVDIFYHFIFHSDKESSRRQFRTRAIYEVKLSFSGSGFNN